MKVYKYNSFVFAHLSVWAVISCAFYRQSTTYDCCAGFSQKSGYTLKKKVSLKFLFRFVIDCLNF